MCVKEGGGGGGGEMLTSNRLREWMSTSRFTRLLYHTSCLTGWASREGILMTTLRTKMVCVLRFLLDEGKSI